MKRKILARLLRRELSCAMSRWQCTVLERKALVHKATKALRRWLHSALARCFVPWRRVAREAGRRRRVMRQIVLRMSRREFAVGFDGWAAGVAQQLEEVRNGSGSRRGRGRGTARTRTRTRTRARAREGPHLCTLHPTPYTLHPTPYTLHPTPYTLNKPAAYMHPQKRQLHTLELKSRI